MKIDFKKLLVKLLPFLFSLATRVWNGLSKEQQTAAERAVRFVQMIRDRKDTQPMIVKSALADAFKVPVTTIDSGLLAIGIALGRTDLSGDDVIKYIQGAADNIEDEIIRSRIYKTAAEAWAQYESPEKFDWKSFALGIIQVAFEMVFKGGVK